MKTTSNQKSVSFKQFIALFIALLMFVSFVGCSSEDPDSITKTGDNDKIVFKTNMDAYLAEYCKQVEKYGSIHLSRDEFEFVEYDGAQFYILNMGTGNLTLYADKEGENFSRVHFMMYNTSEEVPVGILCMLRAFYPNDSVEDMNEAYWNAEDNGSATYKDVKIVFDGNDDLENWTIEINK